METCCWRERVPGQILANNYCQTCEEGTNNCGDKVFQMPLLEQNKPTNPLINNDIVTENPLQPSSPTVNTGANVREPLQQHATNDNGNEVDESLSGDSQSKFDDVGDTNTHRERQASDNSEEFINSNSNSNNHGVVENESHQ
jgi:hypothetical protein